MPSRSNETNSDAVRAVAGSPYALSLLGHALLAGFSAYLLWGPGSRPPLVISLDVIETPVTAPMPLRAAPKVEKAGESRKRAVFGVSRKAVKDETSTVLVKPGNTVAKTPDTEILRPEDADGIPIPTEEFLVTKMPELVADVRVPYPEAAKRKRVQGPVHIEILVDATGSVRQALLLDGPGEGLNEAALEAVKKLKFKPALVETSPVAVKIRYTYRFVLEP